MIGISGRLGTYRRHGQAPATAQMRVLLAAPQLMMRQALTAVLADHPRMRVVGDVGSGKDALRWALEVRPDITLLDAGLGADVHAVYHGRVAFADWLRGFGLLIIIDHGDGYMSLYGHNQSLYKEVGDWVETGEVIASVGNSGGRNHPGLYFEIRHNGVPTNPVLWCKR